MLILLRNIRRKLMNENKFATYLLYAIGEIILVVVGILIAVSIDDWNKEKQDRKKEKSYLQEIRSNLQEDTIRANQVILFDSLKIESVNRTFQVFGSGKTELEMITELRIHFTYLFSFQDLYLSRVAFDNMIAAESINILSDSTLRTQLSNYYSRSMASEERVRELTRKTRDLVAPMLMTPETVKYFDSGMTVKKLPNEIGFYENRQVISMINGSKILAELQLGQAKQMKEEAIEIMKLIDELPR